MSFPQPPSGVLFDLDGTLLDSAPGLYAALNTCARESGVVPAPYATVREVVSCGATAVLRTTWPDATAEELLDRHMPRFLAFYADVMAASSAPFDGVEALLAGLEAAAIPWGIVTNKAGFLTQPLLQDLGLWQRAASVVAGDTLPVRKPDPAPVLHACSQAGITPGTGIFVGDDPRDIEAGRGAGMHTVAAAWGYLNGSDPLTWGADVVLSSPGELLQLLGLPTPA